jgi:hypothetical protein
MTLPVGVERELVRMIGSFGPVAAKDRQYFQTQVLGRIDEV